MYKRVIDIYFLFVILFSGISITFFRRPEGFIILWVVGLIIFIHKLVKPPKTLLYAIVVWTAYFILNTIIIKSLHPWQLFSVLARVMIAWWLISYYKEKIFNQYETTIYILAIISLFFFIWQMAEFQSLNNLVSALDLSGDERASKSFILYTIHHNAVPGDFELTRNCGFTWEPGPFAGFITLAIFFNLARNGVKMKEKIRLGVFLAALITTQSTTGGIGFLAIMAWYAWAHFNNIYIRTASLILAFGIGFILFVSVPFLQDKIIRESQQDPNRVKLLSIERKTQMNPGRFASFYFGWQDLKNYPITGVGGRQDLQYGRQGSYDVDIINGFAVIMSRHGMIGVLLFLGLIIKSGEKLSHLYSFQGYLIYPLLLLIISFGFGIIEGPIIFALWMIPLFLKNSYITPLNNKNSSVQDATA